MISVAMCTYNGELYIEEQLKSILNQTHPVDQIVICDDKSTDKTVQILQNVFKNVSIEHILVVNEKRKGVTKNFEQALKKCEGDYIFLADQDDIWVEDKVEKMLEVMNHKSELLFFSDAYLIDADKNYLKKSLWDNINFTRKERYTLKDFLGIRFVTGATVAIKKDLMVCLPIPECWIHDAWLAINASIRGGVVAVDEKTILYRQHANNVIGVRKTSGFTHVSYCIKSIKKSINFKKVMADRFRSFIEQNITEIPQDELKDLKRCQLFWEETSEITKISILKGMCVIIKNLFLGNYRKYTNGFYSILIDIYINLACKNKER